MRAVRERQVSALLPGQVELLGVGPMLLRVAPGRAEAHEQCLPGRYGHAAQGDLLCCVPQRQVLDARVPAQGLLHHVRPRSPAGADQFQLVGVGEQRVHGVADEVHRRLVAGADHEDQRPHQLGLGEPFLALGPRLQQGAGQVVTGVLGLGRGQVGQERLHLAVEADGLLGSGARVEDRVHHPVQDVAVLGGHPEQFGDDGDGQRQSQRLLQVHRLGPGRRDLVQQLGGDLPDSRP